jgi:hypothetical protein
MLAETTLDISGDPRVKGVVIGANDIYKPVHENLPGMEDHRNK